MRRAVPIFALVLSGALLVTTLQASEPTSSTGPLVNQGLSKAKNHGTASSNAKTQRKPADPTVTNTPQTTGTQATADTISVTSTDSVTSGVRPLDSTALKPGAPDYKHYGSAPTTTDATPASTTTLPAAPDDSQGWRAFTLGSPVVLLLALLLAIGIVAFHQLWKSNRLLRKHVSLLARFEDSASRFENLRAETEHRSRAKPELPGKGHRSGQDVSIESIHSVLTGVAKQVDRVYQMVQDLPKNSPANPQTSFGARESEATRRAASAGEFSRDARSTNEGRDLEARLTDIGNRILRDGMWNLDQLRRELSPFSGQIHEVGDTPEAFLVEGKSSWFAVPNLRKPGKLPPDWFNKEDFQGWNDEFSVVESLPRLIYRGGTHTVVERGRFRR